MIKHNKKVKKAFNHYKKTGDIGLLTKELKRASLKDFEDNKAFLTVI